LTALTDFSPEDLGVLNRTPTAVAMGAAYSQQDGTITLMREMRAGLGAAREAAFAFPDNVVIQFLAAEMQEVDEDREDAHDPDQAGDKPVADPDDEVMEERNPDRAHEVSIELAGQALTIMTNTATIQETVEFKHWLYEIANQVTLACKSGGFLGIGGTQVAEGEAAYLAELRGVLEITEG
jgi:hypothetical protein